MATRATNTKTTTTFIPPAEEVPELSRIYYDEPYEEFAGHNRMLAEGYDAADTDFRVGLAAAEERHSSRVAGEMATHDAYRDEGVRRAGAVGETVLSWFDKYSQQGSEGRYGHIAERARVREEAALAKLVAQGQQQLERDFALAWMERENELDDIHYEEQRALESQRKHEYMLLRPTPEKFQDILTNVLEAKKAVQDMAIAANEEARAGELHGLTMRTGEANLGLIAAQTAGAWAGVGLTEAQTAGEWADAAYTEALTEGVRAENAGSAAGASAGAEALPGALGRMLSPGGSKYLDYIQTEVYGAATTRAMYESVAADAVETSGLWEQWDEEGVVFPNDQLGAHVRGELLREREGALITEIGSQWESTLKPIVENVTVPHARKVEDLRGQMTYLYVKGDVDEAEKVAAELETYALNGDVDIIRGFVDEIEADLEAYDAASPADRRKMNTDYDPTIDLYGVGVGYAGIDEEESAFKRQRTSQLTFWTMALQARLTLSPTESRGHILSGTLPEVPQLPGLYSLPTEFDVRERAASLARVNREPLPQRQGVAPGHRVNRAYTSDGRYPYAPPTILTGLGEETLLDAFEVRDPRNVLKALPTGEVWEVTPEGRMVRPADNKVRATG